jgi:hypothetical protein
MPQNPVLIYAKEGGQPTYMHTVDAAEAIRLGDYTPAPPGDQASPEERASAMSRFKTGQGQTHPELQTEEEKQQARQKANEEAELLAGLPPGTPIVVQAPSDRPAQREARQATQRAQTSSSEARPPTPPPSPPPPPATPPPSERGEGEAGRSRRP